ncbi:MAG: DUF3524 domain-containing protein, partial [Saprospiraceae bacterium]|nr:DUF3524 domain-containing protein [Saprospiraceae bacterium]
MRIFLLEPFFGESHKSWAKGLQRNSRHQVHILSLPDRHWKWRMHGGAVSLADQMQKLEPPDLILATDMLDLATFCGISRLDPSIPRIVYFHENQLTYPWSPTDPDPALKRDNHYSWINFTSALAADHVLFNSNFHRQEFLNALGGFLDQFPDHHNKHEISTIRQRSSVLHLGIDLPGFSEKERGVKPIFLWNHRW